MDRKTFDMTRRGVMGLGLGAGVALFAPSICPSSGILGQSAALSNGGSGPSGFSY